MDSFLRNRFNFFFNKNQQNSVNDFDMSSKFRKRNKKECTPATSSVIGSRKSVRVTKAKRKIQLSSTNTSKSKVKSKRTVGLRRGGGSPCVHCERMNFYERIPMVYRAPGEKFTV